MAAPETFYEEISSECMKDFYLIGQGAFGDIFRARHQIWEIDVAVKILSRNASFTQSELLNEAQAMDKARFLHILRLYGLFVDTLRLDSPRLGLVMEYMENGSLSNLMSQVSFVPWALRFRILYEVALGMNFLHSLNPPLLHLDLKLSNILLNADLHAKVADFGLSKFKRGTTRYASRVSKEDDGCGGTLEYLPPEAFADLSYRPTTGTDVYSYGILMWSLLSGQEPYSNVPPGNLSTLLNRLIPQGQRPSTEALEKINDVQKVQDAIMLMKRCWHNEKVHRPSFRDCSQEMEKAYSCHQPQIIDAVHKVQAILLLPQEQIFSSEKIVLLSSSRAWIINSKKKNSTCKETRFPSASPSVRITPAPLRAEMGGSSQPPTTSSGLEEHLSTLRLEEPSSKQNAAVPPETISKTSQQGKSSGPMTLQRSQSVHGGKGAEKASKEESHQSEVTFRNRPKLRDGKPRRPHSDTYLFPPFPPYHPGFPPYPQHFYRPQQQGDFGLADHSLLPQFGHGILYGGIQFHGQNISGVQFGDHNSMHIVKTLEREPGKKQ